MLALGVAARGKTWVAMIISRDQLIVGRPAVEVRDMLRVMRDRGFTIRGLAERAGMTDCAAERLVADLQAARLVARLTTRWKW